MTLKTLKKPGKVSQKLLATLSIKDVRTRGGRGVSQKRTHADAGGRGGQWQNADVLKIQIFTKIFEVNLAYYVLKETILLNN